MSYCPNCGRQILDESLGCPVCNVRNNIDPTKSPYLRNRRMNIRKTTAFGRKQKQSRRKPWIPLP